MLVLLGLAARVAAADTAFDARRAFADLRALVQLGPRVLGSEASAEAHEMIRERLRQAGWAAEDASEAVTLADGRRATAANIWARKPRLGKPRIFLLAHYDTKSTEPSVDPGANDGASGTALLLELARQFPDGLEGVELHLVLFDAPSPSATISTRATASTEAGRSHGGWSARGSSIESRR